MRITAWGAERNHGTIELMDRGFAGLRTFTVETGEDNRTVGISFTTETRLVLNGNYYVKSTLSKEEIAKFFYYTHREEILGLTDVFGSLRNSEESQRPIRKLRRIGGAK